MQTINTFRWSGFLFCLLIPGFVKAGFISRQIEGTPSEVFKRVSLFSSPSKSEESQTRLLNYVSSFDLMQADQQQLHDIASEKPNALSVQIRLKGKWETALLLKNKTVSEQTLFSVFGAEGKRNIPYQSGACYHGVIQDMPNTLLAISFFEHDVIGVLGTDEGNFVIGRSDKRNYQRNEYIVYNDRDLLVTNDSKCHFGDSNELPFLLPESAGTIETLTTYCVKVYIECDYQFYLDNGSNTTQAINLATGLFNMTQTLFLNDSIVTGLSEVDVWEVLDPYNDSTTTPGILNSFGSAMSGGFNGDLAHLFSARSVGGGIAWLNVLCYPPQYRTALSASLDNSLTPLPTYSWNANVITHEMGHNLGSRHTHACAWNGNNTRIDNCGGHAGYTEGSCADVLPDPPSGGTMMSYCHLVSVGINFNNGFGPQPSALIRNKVNSAVCLGTCSQCNSDITITGNFSNPLTESDTWIKTSGQTTIANTASVILDATPSSGYILLEAATASSFFIATPTSNGMFIAQALDGCQGQMPAKMSGQEITTEKLPAYQLYPNPANNRLTLEMNEVLPVETLFEIRSIDGKLLLKGELNGPQGHIDISSIRQGLYLIRFLHQAHWNTLKFVKE